MGLFLETVLSRSIDDRANDAAWMSFVDDCHPEFDAIVSGEDALAPEQALHVGAVVWRYWMVRGNWTDGLRYLVRTLDEATGKRDRRRVRVMYGVVLLRMCAGDEDGLEEYERECLELAEDLDDLRGVGDILNLMGGNWMERDPDGAIADAMLERSLRSYQMIGDEIGIAEARINLAECARIHRDLETALAHNLEIIRIGRERQNQMLLANTFGNTAAIYRSFGDLETARRIHIDSLRTIRDVGFLHWMGYGLIAAGGLIAELRAHADAAMIMSAGVAALPEGYNALDPNDAAQLDLDIARVKAAIGNDWFARTWLEGSELTTNEAIDLAIDCLQSLEPTA